MAGFSDQRYAQAFRDKVIKISTSVVKEMRPEPRIGKVYSYNPDSNTAMILFAGETIDSLVRARVAQNMRPTKTMDLLYGNLGMDAPADIVRVAGKPGGYYVMDYYSGVPSSTGPAAGGEPIILPGTTANYWRGDKTWQALDRAAVGLSNVDNTADFDKPISTAQQLGLNAKAAVSHTHTPAEITGGGSATQYLRGDKTWQTLDKSTIGLASVDNTTDLSKPISTATQAALNLKAASAHTHVLADLPLGTSAQYLRGDRVYVTLDKVAVGLGSVDNTTDLSKPISTATQSALNLKAASSHTHVLADLPLGTSAQYLRGDRVYVTLDKAAVGLGSVDNTTDLNKPISTATQTALNLKAASAHTHVLADLPLGTSAQYLRGDRVYATLDKTAVGLSNVDNTTDANKPISTATQTALNLKAASAHTHVLADLPLGTSAQYMRGDRVYATLDKAAVGLGSADNTTDLNKPISTATQTAINLKANASAVVDLTTSQSVDGAKNFVKPVMLSQQSGTPTTPVGGSIMFSRDKLPYWMGEDGIERPLVAVVAAIHPGADFEVWVAEGSVERGDTSQAYPTSVKPYGWSFYWSGAKVGAYQVTDKISGQYAARINKPAGTVGTIVRVHGDDISIFDVTPGDIVTFSVWAKSSHTTENIDVTLQTSAVGISPNFYTAGTTSNSRTSSLTNSWKRYEFTFVVPSGHGRARFSILLGTSDTTIAHDFYLDNSGSSISTPDPGQGVPSGAGMEWFDTVLPPGYLWQDGTIYPNETYPSLYARLQNRFGGTPGTSFAVPDKRGRVGVGAGTIYALGTNEGAVETARSLLHTHTITHTHITPSHTHTDNYGTASGSADRTGGLNAGSNGFNFATHSHTMTGGITSSGTGTTGGASSASSGSQSSTGTSSIAFLACNYIIKT